MQSLRWGVSTGQKPDEFLSLLPLVSPPPPDHTKDLLLGPLQYLLLLSSSFSHPLALA